jgi:hypothetical protein
MHATRTEKEVGDVVERFQFAGTHPPGERVDSLAQVWRCEHV